ncbi:hypothetical protein RFI_03804 [Reticulomyxa filosa]|uniref:Uncharacterized protein n=1 Tax=Reticulomyxa filosa TaxID=46433 RepID=X6P6Q6_RETFI|nr:hypothetical protein RFI_03804 [Reticulomyxa filosa]|eukprot:ETO33302.1 hypothetical protein RFI_03804 [Reticulomyxa filosa]
MESQTKAQHEQKQRFRDLVEKLEHSSPWNAFLQKYKINNVRFDVLSDCHYKQAVTLLCFQFSMYGNATNHVCFNASVEDNLPRFRPLVKFAIRMNTSWVALERTTNRVIGVAISRDILESDQIEQEEDNTLLEGYSFHHFRKEIVTKTILSLPELAKFFSKDMKPLKDTKYGQIRYYEVFATDPTFGDKKLGQVLTFLALLGSSYTGYHMCYGIAASPKSHRIGFVSTDGMFPYSFYDYSKLEFSQKTNDHIKSMGDVYLQLQTKYGYTPHYVRHLKAHSKLFLSFFVFDQTKWWLGYVSAFPELLPLIHELFPTTSKERERRKRDVGRKGKKKKNCVLVI